MRFWLERGAAGFRVDMAFSLVKNDGGRRETKRFWQEIRAWLDSDYPEAALVSEWGRPAEALQGRRLRAQRGAHPMQWDAEGPNAGFSSAPPEALYLPLDPRPDRPSVAGQADDPGSLLNQVRALIALSKQHPAVCAGAEFSVLYAEAGQYPLVYERRAPRTATPGAGRAGADRLVVAINPSGRPVQVELPDGLSQVAPVTLYGADGVFSAATTGWSLSMPAVSAGVYRVS